MALHTQTIAAPLHFAGNDPALVGELSAVDFLRQLDIRLLGNNVTLDSEKLAFALHALHGPAHEWYVGLRLRADFVDTFDYFRFRFCHKYRIPGHLPHEFDFALIAKQLPEEDPTQYLARISNYVNLSLIHI